MPRALAGNVVPFNRTREAEPAAGGWLAVRAPQESGPEERARVGRQVVNNLFGPTYSSAAYYDRVDRLLSADQLWRVYQRVPDVRAACDAIARRVATWDWLVEPAEGPAGVATPDVLQAARDATAWLEVPNENGETWQELINKVILDQLVFDRGVIEHVFDSRLEADGSTAPGFDLQELTALRGANVHQITDQHGRLLGYVQDEFFEGGTVVLAPEQRPSAEQIRFIPRQITYLPLTPNTSTTEGVPLIEAIVNEVITIMRSSEHTMLAMDADEIPPGILVLTGIAGKAAEAAKTDLQRLRGKDHKIRVVTNADPQATGAKWVELRRTPKDVDFVRVVQEVRRTIWRVFGVLPVEMGATEDIPRAVGQVQLDVSASHLIGPLLELLEKKVNARILPLVVGDPEMAKRLRFRFDRDAKLTPAEEQQRAQALGALVDRALLTRNEARRRMGEQPVLGGDVPTLTTGQGVLTLTGAVGMQAPVVPEPVALAVGDVDPTNFPKAGDDLEVSLQNSRYRTFDPDYAADLKANWPQIWKAGGNVEGDNQYRRLLPVVQRGGEVRTETEEMAVRKREAWAARHYQDHRLPGVVAQIKWFAVGTLGQPGMKAIVEEEKQRITQSAHRCGPGCKHERSATGLPSAWQSPSAFQGLRVLDLEDLGNAIETYHREVRRLWIETQDEVEAIVRASWREGGIDDDAAMTIQRRSAQAINRLEATWRTATSGIYQRAAKIGRDAARDYTGSPVLDDWQARAAVYQQQAMGWLGQAGGLIPDLQARLTATLEAVTVSDGSIQSRAAGTTAPIGLDPADGLQVVLAAFVSAFQAHEFRIENWGGRLVELANQMLVDGVLQAGTAVATGPEVAGPVPVEWWYEWVAVGDAVTCATCRTEGSRGFQPLATLNARPGGSTECGPRCRCVLVLWTLDEVSSGRATALSGRV
jgi:hypothetical protein